MARVPARLAMAAGLGLLALAVPAQGQDACSQATPCPWYVTLDADGLHGAGDSAAWAFTSGDWYVLEVENEDEVAHVVTLEGHGVAVRAEAFALNASVPFRLGAAGTYALRSDHGGQGTLTVVAGDVNDYEQGLVDASGTSRASPVPLGLAAVALAVAARRLRAA